MSIRKLSVNEQYLQDQIKLLEKRVSDLERGEPEMKEPSIYKQWLLAGDLHLISGENQKKCLEYHKYLARQK